ncbi:hypothetical protein VCR15J2_470045 [Vibrio coralliirubri]|nr:hypothetical protein VCR15J2_470045 [Vibrio coralliirubri]
MNNKVIWTGIDNQAQLLKVSLVKSNKRLIKPHLVLQALTASESILYIYTV